MSGIFMIFLHCTNYVSQRCNNPWSFWCQVSSWYSCIVQTMSQRCNNPWSFWCQVSPWYSCIVQTMPHTQVQQSLILLMSGIFMIFLHCTNYASHTGAAIPDPFDVRYLHDIPALYKLCLRGATIPDPFDVRYLHDVPALYKLCLRGATIPDPFDVRVSPWYSCIVQTMPHTQVQQSLILLMSGISMIFLHCTNYASHTGAAILILLMSGIFIMFLHCTNYVSEVQQSLILLMSGISMMFLHCTNYVSEVQQSLILLMSGIFMIFLHCTLFWAVNIDSDM